jgi:hypothetical protein
MIRRVGPVTVIALLALAFPTSALAGKVKLNGAVAGSPKSKVTFVVQKKNGNLGKITKMKFTKVNVNCSDGTAGLIGGQSTKAFRVSGNHFTKKSKIFGTGIDKGYFRASGKFRRGGKQLTGKVRFSIRTTSGAGCGTGNVKFAAAK